VRPLCTPVRTPNGCWRPCCRFSSVLPTARDPGIRGPTQGVTGPAPLVVELHGGPWERDYWSAGDFDTISCFRIEAMQSQGELPGLGRIWRLFMAAGSRRTAGGCSKISPKPCSGDRSEHLPIPNASPSLAPASAVLHTYATDRKTASLRVRNQCSGRRQLAAHFETWPPSGAIATIRVVLSAGRQSCRAGRDVAGFAAQPDRRDHRAATCYSRANDVRVQAGLGRHCLRCANSDVRSNTWCSTTKVINSPNWRNRLACGEP